MSSLTSTLLLHGAKEHLLALWSHINSSKTLLFPKTKNQKISISAAVALTGLYLIYRKLTLPPPNLRHIPRVNFVQFVGNLLKRRPFDEIYKETIAPLASATDHGVYAAIGMAGWTAFISKPESTKKLLLKTELFPKSTKTKAKRHTMLGKFLMGPNVLFLTDGPHWRAQRSVLNPAFHRSMPIQLFGELTQRLFGELDKVADDSPFDIVDIMHRWTLDAIGIAGFDFDFKATVEENSEWVVRYNHIIKDSVHPFFLLFPVFDSPRLWFLFPKRRKSHEELDLFLDKIQEIITHKREVLANSDKESTPDKKINEKDLLTLMLEAGEEENNRLTDEEIKSNLCAFFIAGHDTTASALSFAIYNLATHPEIQQKAREEAIRVLGDEPVDTLPTLDQIKDMPYIQMIIKETLRLYPIIPSTISRIVAEDTDVGGCVLYKGTPVTFNAMALHRHPLVWSNPDTFNPERFAPGGEAESVSKMGFGWVPFSNGARMCIGMNFSMTEQRVLLPMLLRKYEISLPLDSIHKEKVNITGMLFLKPYNLTVNLKRRY
ncbi:cytochrome P450 [Phascolomyces articulosus]|uniref:Cytochrome P450 n=1 Tax=Phascolomyces articulosus TaxID=60185 RepID=A0AAD5PBE9_9FUNG|nr:cytochrome P450 [Phascolomyces articulosus]